MRRRRADSRAATLLGLCGALLALALSLGAGAVIFNLRTGALEDREREIRNMVLVLAEQSERAFQAVELVQTSLIEAARAMRIDDEAEFRTRMSDHDIHLTLQDKLTGLPHVDTVALVDTEGRLVNFSRAWPVPAVSFAERDFFAALKADPAMTSFVGRPIRNRGTGTWSIILARKMLDANGAFLGVAVGAMQMEYFENLFASIKLPGSNISLFRQDGVRLARFPRREEPDNAYAAGTLFATASTNLDRGVVRVTSPVDGKERLIAGHATAHYPLVAAVGVTVEAALAQWRKQARYLTAAAVLINLVITGIVFLGIRQIRAHELLARVQAERAQADGARARAEAERRNAEVLDATIASMADAVLVANDTGDILIANPAAERLFGDRRRIGSAEWLQHYHRFLPDGRNALPADEEPMTRALRCEPVDDLQLILRSNGGGKDIHLVASGRPLRDSAGGVHGAVVVYRDVTETKEFERQLRQAQKMDAIGQLTGGVAHDFNNILTVITGTIEILADGVRDKPKLAEIAQMIDEAATRGSELTQRLLAFSRKQPLQPRRTDVNAIVREAERLLRPSLGEHIEIESILAEDAWPALVDPSQLTTALINLAVNARDAMPTGGRLLFETRNVVLDSGQGQIHEDLPAGRFLMVAVTDTGTGIPDHIRDRIFEPFFTTKPVGKGTGLGLSMVYGFIKQSGGHIKIYSEEGCGATIKIYLPPEHARNEAQVEAPTITAGQGGNESILVVEDDALVRNYVIAQLQSLGYRTVSAGSGAEALAFLDRGTPVDLLFTDVIMPGMNGSRLAELAQARRPSIKVLYTSGYTENALIHHGRLGADVHLLPKPYRKADLARMVREVLDTGAGEAGHAAAGEAAPA